MDEQDQNATSTAGDDDATAPVAGAGEATAEAPETTGEGDEAPVVIPEVKDPEAEQTGGGDGEVMGGSDDEEAAEGDGEEEEKDDEAVTE